MKHENKELLVAHTSCDLLTSLSEYKNTEPIYTPNIAWTLETKHISPSADAIRYGHYLYIIESTFQYSSLPKEFNIAKVNLKTEKREWTSPIVIGTEVSSVIKSNNNLFIQADNNVLYCFNDKDGALSASIQLTNDTSAWLGEILVYENYLYWGASSITNGLMRFNTNEIDFSLLPTSMQSMQPESIWSGEGAIGALPIVDKGIIYVLTSNDDYSAGKSYSTLVAIELASKKVQWAKDFTFNENGFPVSGKVKQPLYIIEDNIYVKDYASGCYNKNTGETIYEVIQSRENLMREVYLGVSFFARGVAYSDGKFYYATSVHSGTGSPMGYPDEYNKNIICVDAKTGKYVWGDLPPNSSSLATVPVIINGKCYVLSDTGLRVYNADTGKLLGVDPNIGTNGWDRPTQYDDMFIYFNVDYENRVGLLTVIHTN